MTSCGCFECICGIEPCAMGVVITCREYAGITPLGMTFSEMASMTGGGVQTPGFMGHGKHYIASHKFLKAEGGVGRLVWLPKELKDQIRPYWQKAKPYLAFGIECGKAFVQVIAAAYSIYIYGRIIQDSMHGIKDSLNWFKGLN